MPARHPFHPPTPSTIWHQLAGLGLVLRLERRVLAVLFSYAVAIGLFSLVVPLTVQELTNTFAYSIQPVMVVTLALTLFTGLLFIGFFRVFQTSAMETLFQRLYARIAIAMTEHLPRIREEYFVPGSANYFAEAEFLPRAMTVVLVDLINVTVSGATGMFILVLYHPYFLVYNGFLLGGFLMLQVFAGQGSVRATRAVSQLNYETMNWMQDLAQNRLHFKATNSAPLLLGKTDRLLESYLTARRLRSAILTWREYVATVIWEAICHGAMIGMGAWLLSIGQMTLGQFVAGEVIVGTLLVHLDTVARRIYAVTYVLTSFGELTRILALPKDEPRRETSTALLPMVSVHGLHVLCRDVAFAHPDSSPLFQGFDLDVAPGEKIAIVSKNSTAKSALALVLAGLSTPTAGVVRYNDIDLRDIPMSDVNAARGLILDSHLSLFGGSLQDNISLGRTPIDFADLRWAIRFTELEEEFDALPRGMDTIVLGGGTYFTKSQILRILVARAIVTRPSLLILDGSLHNMEPHLRQTLLRRLCSKEEPWSVVFVSNDPTIAEFVERRVRLD